MAFTNSSKGFHILEIQNIETLFELVDQDEPDLGLFLNSPVFTIPHPTEEEESYNFEISYGATFRSGLSVNVRNMNYSWDDEAKIEIQWSVDCQILHTALAEECATLSLPEEKVRSLLNINNDLVVRVDISIYTIKDTEQITNRNHLTITELNALEENCDKMINLIFDKSSDYTLRWVDGERGVTFDFKVHQEVVKESSVWFKQAVLYHPEMIHFNNCTFNAALNLVKFLYSGSISEDMDLSDLESLVFLADFHFIDMLGYLASTQLRSKLNGLLPAALEKVMNNFNISE